MEISSPLARKRDVRRTSARRTREPACPLGVLGSLSWCPRPPYPAKAQDLQGTFGRGWPAVPGSVPHWLSCVRMTLSDPTACQTSLARPCSGDFALHKIHIGSVTRFCAPSPESRRALTTFCAQAPESLHALPTPCCSLVESAIPCLRTPDVCPVACSLSHMLSLSTMSACSG